MAPGVRENKLSSVWTKSSEGPVGHGGSLRPTEGQVQGAPSMDRWAQTTSWGVSEAVPEGCSGQCFRTHSGRRGGAWAGPGWGAGRAGEGAPPKAKFLTRLIRAHTHTAGCMSPSSKISGGALPGSPHPSQSRLQEKQARAGPTKEHEQMCLSKPACITCLGIPDVLVQNAGSRAPPQTRPVRIPGKLPKQCQPSLKFDSCLNLPEKPVSSHLVGK